MLHLLYIIAFTAIAFLAISNLIRSLITVSAQAGRSYSGLARPGMNGYVSRSGLSLHPELLDEKGLPTDEPLLVMRSVSVEDAREQLDALYDASPSVNRDEEEV
ncbi:MAG: DUF2973 domain-containing protein [Chloroflexaceae bacterium]|nr:DUF2973 domain-containing protein [Chloroflexaceae bacterium]